MVPSLLVWYNPTMDFLFERLRYVVTPDGIQEDQDVTIVDNRIAAITPSDASRPTDGEQPLDNRKQRVDTGVFRKIDGRRYAAISGFKNGHTHAAMVLLRGYGDDMRLQEWLQHRIWPAESALTGDDIYWGTRAAAIEMVKSGTTFANDMYFFFSDAWRAFVDSGMRAAVGLALFDFGDSDRRKQVQREVDALLEEYAGEHGRVFPTIAPHSIYTCSTELLQWSARRAEELHLPYHIHMSETRHEVEQCVSEHGVPPWRYLAKIGVLDRIGDAGIAAHGVWLDEEELKIAGDHRFTLVYNPGSNMKLASGAFDWSAVRGCDIPVMLAPDGVASNNNLDMFDEMKLATLLQKHHFGDPTRLPAAETLALATGAYSNVFHAQGVAGALAEGAPGDIVLIDLDHPQIQPVHNIASNLVYAGHGSIVDTVIIDGEIVMEHRNVAEESKVISQMRNRAFDLIARASSEVP